MNERGEQNYILNAKCMTSPYAVRKIQIYIIYRTRNKL